LLESHKYGGLLCACDFLFEQFWDLFLLQPHGKAPADWIFQNYVAHGGLSSANQPGPMGKHTPAVSLQEQSYIFLVPRLRNPLSKVHV